MFKYARLRLTLLYLLIIALISVSFSAVIYNDFVFELENRLIHAQSQLRGLSIPRQVAQRILQGEVEVARKAVIFRLLVLNGAILVISGVGGYFLAGKTLSPIEEALEEQKRFVGDASHELRTPLTSLKTEIEVALRDKRLTLTQAKRLLKSNLCEIDKMKDLSNYLLTLNRYEVGGNGVKTERLDLAKIAASGIANNKKLADQKKVKIITKLESVVMQGDPSGLVELVSILVNNAVKYSNSGKRVDVLVQKTNRYNQITIADRGPGVPKKEAGKIFERFYRAEVSRSKAKIEGYGLGLSIAKSIAETHRGVIKVSSRPGGGAKFTVNFPRYF